jgi:hypothetical protein
VATILLARMDSEDGFTTGKMLAQLSLSLPGADGTDRECSSNGYRESAASGIIVFALAVSSAPADDVSFTDASYAAQ